ncbi:MoaD/ThiS family protein [Phaeobacter gallaeciensis]|uniref:ThiS family protein n=1 Tax=Phaeobacter gallaeciensis TaxID=60890 RepID=A0AAC9Z8X3_9RHOB|nr:MoaD/ThiS family protein [Phaeobacter gallaeciensis]AHD09476.1 ThiS family [Phaeobacter gallaeciensis DSM 26640]ATE92739.1 ThiS family protein [Phaeobacter gallaeciensis]ATE97439.1 ThiS family protein [Phaeobacter gallaeciensis]ATF01404.1 ThiS family protein [Phaeobacter gallaeciensis]ATF05784.1 ThiS family protein [Phaeobacter gallaeciensis]
MAAEHITTGQGAAPPRLTVHLWSGLRRFAEGQRVVEVSATTTGTMIAALKAAYPALGPALDAGVSVAVDGRIIATSLDEPLKPENEIYLIQRLRGG